jgi:hypothetical protein
MLLARILAAMDERTELAAVLRQIDAGELDPDEQIVYRSLAAVARRADRTTWSELLAESAGLAIPSRLEIVMLAARCGELAGPQREEAITLASNNPLFVGRLNEI